MNKYFITYCDYPVGNIVRDIYDKHTKPRFLEYCQIHGYEFIEITENIAAPYNLGFAKVEWIKQNWERFSPGDIITYMDIDCCIMDATQPAIFDADFAIVKESTGCLCMGGTWSLRVSGWSKKFIEEMCSPARQEANKSLQSWNTWHENDAVYHVLGLNWGDVYYLSLGSRETTPFTKDELVEHVLILEADWGTTYCPEDVDWSANTFQEGDCTDSDWGYKYVAKYFEADRYVSFDNIKVRHLSGGTMHLDWANRYYNTKMKT